MNPNKLRAAFEEKSREEAERRQLAARAQELEAEQQSVIKDLRNFYKALLSEEELQLRSHTRNPSDRKRNSLKILLADNYEDRELGRGIIGASIRTLNTDYVDKHVHGGDFEVAQGFGVVYTFTPKSQDIYSYDIARETFPGECVGEHGVFRTWGVGTLHTMGLEQVKQTVSDMETQIIDSNLRQRADETLELLRNAASNPKLNPEFAERLKKAGTEELQEEG